jgi:uncharacterized membrane protein (DUF485 family)
MKQRTEMLVIAGLIVYLSFFKPFGFLREIMATPIGKALALSGIVYVWKYVSPVVAGLLIIVYVRCASMSNIFEGMENASESCKCPAGYLYDEATKKCRNPKGETKTPEFCPCPTGYFWDVISGECKASSPETPSPVPVVTADNKAPATSSGPVTSSAPMTTPSAVQDAIANMTPPPATMGGVQPTAQTTESFSPY